MKKIGLFIFLFLLSFGTSCSRENTKWHENLRAKQNAARLEFMITLGEEDDAIELLKRLDPNAHYNGWTPLCLSAKFGRLKLCKYLISQDVDVNKPSVIKVDQSNSYNSSIQLFSLVLATQFACSNNCQDMSQSAIVQLLLANGAKINVQDHVTGKTAWNIAAQFSNKPLMDYLFKVQNLMEGPEQ